MGRLREYINIKKREHAKRKLTGYLGKTEEYEDRILCYIEKKPRNNHLKCHGVDDYSNLAKKYKLDKPITYIFLCLDFNDEECVIEGDSDVNFFFNNCSFSEGLNINTCDSLNILHSYIGKELKVVADTVLLSDVSNKSEKHSTLNIDIDAYDITIEGSDFEDRTNKLEQAYFYINAGNRLTLRRSNIGRQNNNDIVEIYADTLESYDSTFATPAENNNPQSLAKKNNKTMISSSKIIKLYGNPEEIGNILIDAPEILVNGTSYKYNVSISQSIYPEVNLQRIINPVSVKKLQLIELLKKLQTKCGERYTEKRKLYDEELKQQPLKRLLEK